MTSSHMLPTDRLPMLHTKHPAYWLIDLIIFRLPLYRLFTISAFVASNEWNEMSWKQSIKLQTNSN